MHIPSLQYLETGNQCITLTINIGQLRFFLICYIPSSVLADYPSFVAISSRPIKDTPKIIDQI